MRTIHHFPRPNSTTPRTGSALLLTLLVVSLLLVITLAFTVYIRSQNREIVNHQQRQQARQNAKLGLQLAIGRLQDQTGIDQRVTTPADIVMPEGLPYAQSHIDSYWNAQRNQNWTGAWKNSNTETFDPNNPVEFNPEPALLSWLVSLPNGASGIAPTTKVLDLNANSSPEDILEDENELKHILLVSPAVGAANRAVTAPRVSINTPASSGGNYAWWVGDEGVKARVDLIDPYAEETDEESRLRRIASAQRAAIEAMDNLESHYEPNSPEFNQLNHLSEFYFLPDNAGDQQSYQQAIDSHFHDLTLVSRGVLSDTKHGGLKHDLSYILGQSTISDMRDAVENVYSPLGGGSVTPSSQSNRILYEAVTPLVTFPSSPPELGIIEARSPSMFAYTPRGAYTPSGQAESRRHVRHRHGVHPITMHGKVFYRLGFSGGEISIDVRPLVVLANPYSVDLAPAEYKVRFDLKRNAELHFLERSSAGGEPDQSEILEDDENTPGVNESTEKASVSNGGLGAIYLTIDSGVIPAGEARVYTLGQDYILPTTQEDQEAFEVRLVNDFNSPYYLSTPTGQSLPATASDPALTTYATLYTPGPGFDEAYLYLDDGLDPSANLYFDSEQHRPNDRQLLHRISAHISSGTDNNQYAFLVFPTLSEAEGGGVSYHLFDSGYTGNQQHSLFLQQNYRTNVIDGFHGSTGPTHLLQWARGLIKKGTPGNKDYFKADLIGLTQDDAFKNIRWGALNTGDRNSSYNTVEIPGVGSGVGFRNWMYDIPTPGVPLSSIGQLQHINVNAFVDATTWKSHSGNHNTLGRNHQKANTVQSWQSNYTISNSYANPRVRRNRLIDYENSASNFHYDGSYIWNSILWDRFYFSTYPAQGDFDFASDTLVNARYRPFRDSSEIPLDDPVGFRDDSLTAASNLMVDGAFNINSTSINAWKALFASLRGVPVGTETDPNAPFVRTLKTLGGSDDAETANHVNSWNGFRDLSDDEIEDLAEEMVMQVRRRGPFLSMADFVNRKLVTRSNDTEGLGLSGALQSAIDSVTNSAAEVDSIFRVNTSTHPNHIVEPEYRATTVVDGFPGYLLQSDILSSVGQNLTARSDTFRIRAYGDVTDASGNSVNARAWCEAIVQRTPDYLSTSTDPNGNHPYDAPTNPVNEILGRRYQILSFRWLNPEEI